MNTKLRTVLKHLARQAGGAHKTVHDRILIIERLYAELRQHNIQIKHIDNQLAHGINKRTLQNEMAAIRGVFKQAGREKLANSEALSKQTLNIHNTSRDCTRTAITPEHYQTVLQTAQAKDQGLAAAIRLARVMGLRGEEAVQSVHSLQIWHKALKQTMIYWRNQIRRIGLEGKRSPHSLRYAWAQEAIYHYKQQGYTEKEALVLTSMDLGHGDGRGRYVARVYGGKSDEAS